MLQARFHYEEIFLEVKVEISWQHPDDQQWERSPEAMKTEEYNFLFTKAFALGFAGS